MFHMNFTYVLHPRPLRICIRTPSSGPIDRSPGGFWDSANAYPELLRGGRCKLVVVALEVGGRWSTEAASFIRQLAQTRCRAAPAALQTATAQAYIARWSALLTHAAQTAFAKSLLFEDLWLHTAGDGESPLLSDLLDLRTTPPDISRPLDLLLDFALGLRGNLETGQYKNSLPTTKLLGDQMDMAEKGVRKKQNIWLVVWNTFCFSMYWEESSQLTNSFQRVQSTNQLCCPMDTSLQHHKEHSSKHIFGGTREHPPQPHSQTIGGTTSTHLASRRCHQARARHRTAAPRLAPAAPAGRAPRQLHPRQHDQPPATRATEPQPCATEPLCHPNAHST